jgi:hypothetical protein
MEKMLLGRFKVSGSTFKVSMAEAVSMPAAFLWLTPFLSFRFHVSTLRCFWFQVSMPTAFLGFYGFAVSGFEDLMI